MSVSQTHKDAVMALLPVAIDAAMEHDGLIAPDAQTLQIIAIRRHAQGEVT